MENLKSFESLEAWKIAREFRKEISVITKTFPQYEQFRLTDQIIRSFRSVSANIAEGYGRFHYLENIRSCVIARGSLTETLDHLLVASDENYITEKQLVDLRKRYEHCLKLINGYILFLRTRKKNETAKAA
jgi:four helix bundle protein